MIEALRVKIPKKFKIINKADAERWFHNPDKWNSLKWPYKAVVIRSLCFWDISFFADRITQRWTTSKKSRTRFPIPQFHKDLWKICIEDGDIVVICPRGFAKTTAVSKIFSLWCLLFELEQSILIISSKGLGENIIGDIRRELEENRFIKIIWGQVVPSDTKKNESDKWRQNELQLLNGTEIKTLTKGQAVRGHRPTLILIDDPEENKDVKNPSIAEEFFQWVWSSLYNALDDGGRMIVLGTVISSSCFVNRLKNEASQRSFLVFEFPAIIGFDWKLWEETHDFDLCTANASTLWPERWTLPKLKAKFEKLTEKPFFQEFMNRAFIINKTPVFHTIKTTIVHPLEVVGNWHIFSKPHGKDLFIGIDIANGSTQGDYSVMMVRDAEMNLIAMYRGHIAQDILAIELNTALTETVLHGANDCFIVPENNMGIAFLNEARNYNFLEKIYRQKTFDKVTQKESEVLGWNTNGKTKILMITEYGSVLRQGLDVSEIGQTEIEHYYFDEKGGMNAISPHHDDTVIADALCIQAVKHGLLAPMFMIF